MLNKRKGNVRLPGGKTVEVDDKRESEKYISKTVKQNDHKMTDGRRQSVQQDNYKRVTRQERSFADVVSQGGKPGYSWDSIIGKVDIIVKRVCQPGTKIKDIAEKQDR